MRLDTGTKFNLALVLVFIGICTCNYFAPKEVKDEIIIDGVHVNRKPCIEVVNELFGRGVDSSKICDCLIPEYYKLIKRDSILFNQFKQSGGSFRELEGALNDSLVLLFAGCARTNILDASQIFHLKPGYKLRFKQILKEGFRLREEFKHFNAEYLSDCIVEKLNGHITTGEYFADDYFQVPEIKRIMKECAEHSLNK